MTENWNEHASRWDDNPDVKLYAEKAFASLDAQIGLRGKDWKSKRVLDFGCGTGLLAQKVAPYVGELVAVDTSEKMIAVLTDKNIPNVVAIHGDILASDTEIGAKLGAGFDRSMRLPSAVSCLTTKAQCLLWRGFSGLSAILFNGTGWHPMGMNPAYQKEVSAMLWKLRNLSPFGWSMHSLSKLMSTPCLS